MLRSSQLDLHNSKKTNLKLPRYIDWGEAIMFSPPSTFGMSFHLCTRVLDSEWSAPFDVNGQKEVVSGLTSCITLRQLKIKKRTKNIQLAGGSASEVGGVVAGLGGAVDLGGAARPISSRKPGGLERLAEEDVEGREIHASSTNRDRGSSVGAVSNFDDDGDGDDKSDSDVDSDEEHNWGVPLVGMETMQEERRRTIKQKQTSIYKPAATSSAAGSGKGNKSKDRRCQYDVGVHCASGKDVYFRTTVITFLPRYMLVNDLRIPIEITQSGCEDDWRMTVPGGTSTGFHWPFKDKSFLMCARLQSDGFTSPSWTWSGEFSIDALGEVALKVRQKFRPSEIFLIRVVVKLVDASIVVLLEQVDEFVPYR